MPGPGQLEPWLMKRAAELEIELQPAAARLLAERVGGHIRESDVDRRRRTELANGELEKLALYRPEGSVSRDDVEALVSESIPGFDVGLPRRRRLARRAPPPPGSQSACSPTVRRCRCWSRSSTGACET